MTGLLVVGSGSAPYRRYALERIAARYDVALLDTAPPTWQAELVRSHRTVDLGDLASVTAAARDLTREVPVAGVLTYEEQQVVTAALVAEALRLPHNPPDAARACRDKAAQREAFAAAGVPSAGWVAAGSQGEALDAAAAIGYPVVVKPRALAGSVGVRLVRDPAELAEAYAAAAGSSYDGFAGAGGVVVEEYLDGPEVSADAWVLDGEVEVLALAVKELGYPPWFEEVGHLVPVAPLAMAEEVKAAVAAANLALGVDRLVTHTEVRLTAAGPKIVEVNGRLGGDLIPLVGELATGVDVAGAAADAAAGRLPARGAAPYRAAGVRFVYPPHDLRVLEVRVDPAAGAVAEVGILAGTGRRLRLPPGGHLGRAAYVVATGEDDARCRASLAEAAAGVTVLGARL